MPRVARRDASLAHEREHVLQRAAPRPGAGRSSKDELAPGEVERGGRHVVDVHLDAEPGHGARRRAPAACWGGPARVGRGVALGDGAGLLQLADDGADGGLGQSRAPGEVGPAERSGVAQQAQHQGGVPAAYLVGGRRTGVQRTRSAHAVEVLERQLVEALEGHAAGAERLDVGSRRCLEVAARSRRRPAVGTASSGSWASSSAACTSGSARKARTFSRRIR